MKKRTLTLANFVVLLAPILVFAILALGIAGMGGAFDRYKGTWVGTIIESSFPVARTFWIVAALLNLVLIFLCVLKKAKLSGALMLGSLMNLAAFLLGQAAHDRDQQLAIPAHRVNGSLQLFSCSGRLIIVSE